MSGPILSSLITKLSVANFLDGDDIRAVLSLPLHTRQLDSRETIALYGNRPHECCLVSEGFAFRSKTLVDGQRQIIGFHIPGEISDLQGLHLKIMDHDLTTLTACTLGFISHAALKKLSIARPNIAAALWRETLADAAVFGEWIVNIGRRTAIVRMAHLLSELQHRLSAIGRSRHGTFEFPITQLELGDSLGISTVHTNRVLKELREQGLLKTERSFFHLSDMVKLMELGQFEPAYLHQHPQA